MTDELHPEPADDTTDELADDPMIARMRSALDEAARIDPGTARPVPAPDRRRWFAVAAAAVLVAGGIAALAVNLSRDHTPAAGPVPDTGTLLTGQATIIDMGQGPKMAVTLQTSLPPQGGDIPLAGFDWSMIDDEQTVSGTTWTDTFQQITGTWDGSTFTLAEPPVPAVPSVNTSTPSDANCPDDTTQAAANAISTLDAQALHLTEWYPQSRQGVCGVHVGAWFDTQELRGALDGVRAAGHDVQAQYVFNPVSTDTTDPTTTTASTTEPSNPAASGWYEITAPGLSARPPEFTVCCAPMPAPGPDTVMVWTDAKGGLFMLQAVGQLDGSPAVLQYSSFGIDATRVAQLKTEVVPGSGLPYILADPDMTLLAQGLTGFGSSNSVSQRYIPSAGDGDVLLSVGDYNGQLHPLGDDVSGTQVTIAGLPGYRYTNDSATVYIWHTPANTWAELRIATPLASRADEIVASLTPAPVPSATTPTSTTQTIPETKPTTTIGVPDTTPTAPDTSWPHADLTYVSGEPLPPFDSAVVADPAVGLAAPQFGATLDTSAFGPQPLVPTLVVFTATWCPHCKATLPDLLATETNGSLASVHLVVVQTANRSDATLYDHADYVRWGHTEPVLVDPPFDPSHGDGAAGKVATAYGATGWPYFVLVGTDGTVLGRWMGEMTMPDLQQVIATAIAKAG
jgi:thiol-disulfide isomerase/thioredoxin